MFATFNKIGQNTFSKDNNFSFQIFVSLFVYTFFLYCVYMRCVTVTFVCKMCTLKVTIIIIICMRMIGSMEIVNFGCRVCKARSSSYNKPNHSQWKSIHFFAITYNEFESYSWCGCTYTKEKNSLVIWPFMWVIAATVAVAAYSSCERAPLIQ